MTRLEICILCEVPDEVCEGSTVVYKEDAMAVLACIVVACSARLEALHLRLDGWCTSSCTQDLLVRLLWLSPPQPRLGVFAF